MEKIAARTPGFERGLHRRHGYREVLNPCDVWYVLRFLAIRRVSSGGMNRPGIAGGYFV
jgi:hypothetical protein